MLTLNPTLKTYLLKALRKLDRYYEVAQNLTDAARSTRYLLFQQITILAIECNSISIESLISGLIGFDEAISRIANSSINSLQFSRQDRNLARMKYQNRIFRYRTK